jgi:hypothetical protein
MIAWSLLFLIPPKLLVCSFIFLLAYFSADRLCGLVVGVPGYRSRGSGFDSGRYQIFWEVVGQELGPLCRWSTIWEPLGRNNSGSGLEIREYGRGNPLRWPRDICPLKLALTLPTSGGHSVGIVLSRIKATGLLVLVLVLEVLKNCMAILIFIAIDVIKEHFLYSIVAEQSRNDGTFC